MTLQKREAQQIYFLCLSCSILLISRLLDLNTYKRALLSLSLANYQQIKLCSERNAITLSHILFVPTMMPNT